MRISYWRPNYIVGSLGNRRWKLSDGWFRLNIITPLRICIAIRQIEAWSSFIDYDINLSLLYKYTRYGSVLCLYCLVLVDVTTGCWVFKFQSATHGAQNRFNKLIKCIHCKVSIFIAIIQLKVNTVRTFTTRIDTGTSPRYSNIGHDGSY